MKIRAHKLNSKTLAVESFTIHPLGREQFGYLDKEDIRNLDTIADKHFFLKFSVKKKAYVFYLKFIKLIPDSIFIEIEDSLLTVSQVDFPKSDAEQSQNFDFKDADQSSDAIDHTNETDKAHSNPLTFSGNPALGFAHTFALPLFIKIDALEFYYRDNILLIIVPRD